MGFFNKGQASTGQKGGWMIIEAQPEGDEGMRSI